MDVSLPAFAHRVTVLGSTRNIVATSAGVSNGSASGVRADMWPLLLDQYCDPALSLARLRVEPAVDVPYDPTEAILPSPGVTSRPPGARFCDLCPDWSVGLSYAACSSARLFECFQHPPAAGEP